MCRCRFTHTVALLLALSFLIAAKPKKEAPADPAVPPRDAQWTIYCQAIAGPEHVARANAAKQSLATQTQLKDAWYVIHQEDQSVIYYGYYRAINDPKDKKETDRAQADRKTLEGLTDQNGNKVLSACMFVEAAAPDPEAPAEWDLRNARGYWSLEIGVYKDSPQRKQVALDTVREARKRGEEAYYFHGPTASSVCIGAWPREAVREQDAAEGAAGDPAQDILVLPGPVAGNVEVRNRDGQRVQALAPKTEILDPSMLAAISKYPTRSLNGEDYLKRVTDPTTGKDVDVLQQSVLVPIPVTETASLLRASQPPPALVTPSTPSQTPGAGKLKSIGQ